MLIIFALLACAPEVPNLHIDFMTSVPVDVDTIADDTNLDGVVTGYHTEEFQFFVELDSDPYANPDVIQPSVDLSKYSISYASAGSTQEMPIYESGITIHIDQNDEGDEGYSYDKYIVGFNIRAVSFVQKDWAHSQFDGEPMNYTGTLTLSGTANSGVDVTAVANFDLIFADFDEP